MDAINQLDDATKVRSAIQDQGNTADDRLCRFFLLQKELATFVEQEQAKARLTSTIHSMTGESRVGCSQSAPRGRCTELRRLADMCFDKCVPKAPDARFSRGEESCLVNCVDRFLDTSSASRFCTFSFLVCSGSADCRPGVQCSSSTGYRTSRTATNVRFSDTRRRPVYPFASDLALTKHSTSPQTLVFAAPSRETSSFGVARPFAGPLSCADNSRLDVHTRIANTHEYRDFYTNTARGCYKYLLPPCHRPPSK